MWLFNIRKLRGSTKKVWLYLIRMGKGIRDINTYITANFLRRCEFSSCQQAVEKTIVRNEKQSLIYFKYEWLDDWTQIYNVFSTWYISSQFPFIFRSSWFRTKKSPFCFLNIFWTPLWWWMYKNFKKWKLFWGLSILQSLTLSY